MCARMCCHPTSDYVKARLMSCCVLNKIIPLPGLYSRPKKSPPLVVIAPRPIAACSLELKMVMALQHKSLRDESTRVGRHHNRSEDCFPAVA